MKFTYDSRDRIHSNMFGQVFTFPDEVNFDTQLHDDVQPIGDVKCTCYTSCDIAEDQNNIIFDIDDLWQRVRSTPQGADPREVLGEAVKNGLLPKGKTERLKNWRSYWRGDLGSADPFDNLRSSMLLAQSPVGIGTYWYKNWHNTTILPVGEVPQNGHMYCAEGWKQINGEPHLIIEGWFGRKVYMPRATFNAAVKPSGMQTWVLSTAELDLKRQKTLIETIKDLMINLIIVLRDKIKTKQAEMIVPVPIPLPVPEPAINKYDWDTPMLARHSVRVICDEMDLTVEQKNTMCATIGAESGWKPGAIGKPNTDGTRDYGIVQINSYWWIGEGKQFPSADFVLNNPEECVRWMCRQWKAGKRHLWSAWNNGSYKSYL